MLEKNYHTGELSALPLIMPLKKTKAITETRLTLITKEIMSLLNTRIQFNDAKDALFLAVAINLARYP